MKKFAFTDLHSFKDYIGFVMLCAPDGFPDRTLVPSTEDWTLEMAFEGLRLGIREFVAPKVPPGVVEEHLQTVEEAYDLYNRDDVRGGFAKMKEFDKAIRRLRSK